MSKEKVDYYLILLLERWFITVIEIYDVTKEIFNTESGNLGSRKIRR